MCQTVGTALSIQWCGTPQMPTLTQWHAWGLAQNRVRWCHIDSAEKSLNLQCRDNAATLSIVGTSELIPAGVAEYTGHS